MKEPTKAELLEEYAGEFKKVRRFLQVDVFAIKGPGDSWMRPDEDGDCVFYGQSHELRSSGDDLVVRIQIPYGASREAALRMIDKAREVMTEENWEAGMFDVYDADVIRYRYDPPPCGKACEALYDGPCPYAGKGNCLEFEAKARAKADSVPF